MGKLDELAARYELMTGKESITLRCVRESEARGIFQDDEGSQVARVEMLALRWEEMRRREGETAPAG
jgi:hypothetical protein